MDADSARRRSFGKLVQLMVFGPAVKEHEMVDFAGRGSAAALQPRGQPATMEDSSTVWAFSELSRRAGLGSRFSAPEAVSARKRFTQGRRMRSDRRQPRTGNGESLGPGEFGMILHGEYADRRAEPQAGTV